MRCCIETILEYMSDHEKEEVETLELDCKYEPESNKRIIIEKDDATWRWNK